MEPAQHGCHICKVVCAVASVIPLEDDRWISLCVPPPLIQTPPKPPELHTWVIPEQMMEMGRGRSLSPHCRRTQGAVGSWVGSRAAGPGRQRGAGAEVAAAGLHAAMPAGRGRAAGETQLDGSTFFQACVSVSLYFTCFYFLLKARCLISSTKNKALSAR